ncbi:IclR family transcriptional regulator [Natrinema caseinilyticum]|uniref:IclR family transcriptional regulator n=1 Tax=Natrinema caseinilyticum TaxID=2961570 RepID=UPI0020C50735|nr:IclR family transcriptional regulator [Natrinema caseinilyticum]
MTRDLPIKSLRTAFAIVEELVDRNGAGVSELATAMDRPKSTIYDHLVTLHELGYLVERDETYYVSSNFLRIGDLNRQSKEIYQASSEELERLAAETGEHASLTIEEHGKAVIIATEEGDEAIPVKTYSGIVMDMHTSAPGKAILAFMDEDEVSDIIDRNGLTKRTENTIHNRDELREELAWIREHNYALDDEERLTGMRSVAAPVIDRDDRVRGSLTIYGPTNRINDQLFREEFPELLMRSGNIVEVLMNYD